VYTAPSGSLLIEGGDLTLDAKGNANAIWVFQMASTLTVGGPGATAPQSIILAGGAQAKNIFWQVGTAATINAGGGGTMVGTIIAQAGVTFSTVGNTTITTLNGRALSLGTARAYLAARSRKCRFTKQAAGCARNRPKAQEWCLRGRQVHPLVELYAICVRCPVHYCESIDEGTRALNRTRPAWVKFASHSELKLASPHRFCRS
jgi:hypothetical protein